DKRPLLASRHQATGITDKKKRLVTRVVPTSISCHSLPGGTSCAHLRRTASPPRLRPLPKPVGAMPCIARRKCDRLATRVEHLSAQNCEQIVKISPAAGAFIKFAGNIK